MRVFCSAFVVFVLSGSVHFSYSMFCLFCEALFSFSFSLFSEALFISVSVCFVRLCSVQFQFVS